MQNRNFKLSWPLGIAGQRWRCAIKIANFGHCIRWRVHKIVRSVQSSSSAYRTFLNFENRAIIKEIMVILSLLPSHNWGGEVLKIASPRKLAKLAIFSTFQKLVAQECVSFPVLVTKRFCTAIPLKLHVCTFVPVPWINAIDDDSHLYL